MQVRQPCTPLLLKPRCNLGGALVPVLMSGMRVALVLILLYPEANPTQITISAPSSSVFNLGFDNVLFPFLIQVVNLARK